MILLDTHAAIWLITESDFLGPTSRATIRSAVADGALFVSAITFWEIALLVSKRRLQALRTPSQQRMTILNSGVHELPITGEIAILSVELENLPADPADRLIMATAIKHSATLITADEALLHWQHPITRIPASK